MRLASVAKLEQLDFLDLSGCKLITDRGLEHLRKMTSLKAINVPNNPAITERKLQELRKALPGASIIRSLF